MHPFYNKAHAWSGKVIGAVSIAGGVPPGLRLVRRSLGEGGSFSRFDKLKALSRSTGEVGSPRKNAAKLSGYYPKVAKEPKEAMHPLYQKAHALSSKVIGAAIEVHRLKGPGLIESIYERCLMRELELQGITATNQVPVKVEYKGLIFEEPLRLDVFIENCLIVENKVVEQLLPIHKAQLLS